VCCVFTSGGVLKFTGGIRNGSFYSRNFKTLLCQLALNEALFFSYADLAFNAYLLVDDYFECRAKLQANIRFYYDNYVNME